MTRGSIHGITTRGITALTGIIRRGTAHIGAGVGAARTMLTIITIITMAAGGLLRQAGVTRLEVAACTPTPGIADMLPGQLVVAAGVWLPEPGLAGNLPKLGAWVARRNRCAAKP